MISKILLLILLLSSTLYIIWIKLPKKTWKKITKTVWENNQKKKNTYNKKIQKKRKQIYEVDYVDQIHKANFINYIHKVDYVHKIKKDNQKKALLKKNTKGRQLNKIILKTQTTGLTTLKNTKTIN